jgi:hypothetical protein
MWQLLRDKLIEREKIFVPQVKMFKPLNERWKIPLSLDLINNIRDKKVRGIRL